MSARPPNPSALHLRDHRFFRGLDEEFLKRLGEKSYERSFEAGNLIVREGDPADEFLVIFEGKVALEIVLPDRPHRTVRDRRSLRGRGLVLAPAPPSLEARRPRSQADPGRRPRGDPPESCAQRASGRWLPVPASPPPRDRRAA